MNVKGFIPALGFGGGAGEGDVGGEVEGFGEGFQFGLLGAVADEGEVVVAPPTAEAGEGVLEPTDVQSWPLELTRLKKLFPVRRTRSQTLG